MIFKLSETESLRNNNLEDRIDALLPQTQCGKCDYDGCRPYARAIANNEVDFNRCPPGGNETIDQIAAEAHQVERQITILHSFVLNRKII